MERSSFVLATGLALLASGISMLATLPLLGVLPNAAIMQRWPTGANNRANAAAALVTADASPASIAHAEEMARGVLAQEPVNVVAMRTLGLIAAFRRDPKNASIIFKTAETLSRRDKPTQLFLIEDSVSRGDVSGALLHYDRVLRNAPDLQKMLFPILRAAADDPDIGPKLASLVARKPLWGPWFIRSLINDPADSSQFLYMTARRMRPSLASPAERDFLIGVITRLVGVGKADQALDLYKAAKGDAGSALVRDGGFDHSPDLPPLDWQLTDNDGFGSTREAGDDGTSVLKLSASESQSGVVARQVLLLRPGVYRLTLNSGGINSEERIRPIIRLSCLPDGKELMAFEIRSVGAHRKLASPAFTVPLGCAAQSLDVTLDASGGIVTDQTTPWIDNVAIVGESRG